MSDSSQFNIQQFLAQMLLQKPIEDTTYLGPYQVVAQIEEGTQAKILLGRIKGKFYGLKLYKHGHLGRSCFQNQIEILCCIDDQLIVKPLEIYLSGASELNQHMHGTLQPFLVMQYYQNGDLRHFMNSENITPRIRNYIIKGLARCLMATEMYGVLHRDIKPENFLIDSNYNLKLIDFGVGIHANDQSEDIVGTTNYIAPQIHKSRNYSYKSEIFAIGVICFQLAMGRKSAFPFKQAKISDPNFLLLKQKMFDRFWNKFPNSKQFDPQFKEFLQRVLSPDPELRPSASQILLQNCLKDTASQQQCKTFFQKSKPSSKIPEGTIHCPTF